MRARYTAAAAGLLVSVSGCIAPLQLVADDRPVPLHIIQTVCETAVGGPFSTYLSDGTHPTHWDGQAIWIVNSKSQITGLECWYTYWSPGYPASLWQRIALDDPAAAPLQHYFDSYTP